MKSDSILAVGSVVACLAFAGLMWYLSYVWIASWVDNRVENLLKENTCECKEN